MVDEEKNEVENEKKVTSVITVLVLLAIIAGGVYYFIAKHDAGIEQGEQKYTEVVDALDDDNSSEVDTLIAEIPYDKCLYDGPDAYPEDFSELELYKNILDYAGDKAGRYLWLEDTREIKDAHYGIFNVTKETMQEKLTDAEINPETNTREEQITRDIDELEECAAALILKFTDYEYPILREGKSDLYQGFEGNGKFHCFNGYNFGNSDGVKEMQKARLNLDFSNVKVNTIIAEEVLLEIGKYYAYVSADVTCVKNDGPFKDIEWIPEKGESRKVDMLVQFQTMRFGKGENESLHATIADLYVYDYEE